MSAVFDVYDAPPAAGAGPYEGQRRRLALMERLTAARLDLSVERARELVGRETRLTSAQIVNIRKRKRKGLYDDLKARIDAAFVALAARVVRDLESEIALVAEAPRGLDPRELAKAEAARDALAALIAEAREMEARSQ